MPTTDSAPHWSMIDVAGHPCECFDPPGAAPGIAMIYLHGVRERTLQQSTGLREAIEIFGPDWLSQGLDAPVPPTPAEPLDA